jgi:hypothetical protein
LITGEINRILRDMSKDSGSHQNDQTRLVWRREYDYQSELEHTRLEILKAEERALEAQKRCEELELQASIAEERFAETVRKMNSVEVEEQVESPHDTNSSTHAALMEQILSSKQEIALSEPTEFSPLTHAAFFIYLFILFAIHRI